MYTNDEGGAHPKWWGALAQKYAGSAVPDTTVQAIHDRTNSGEHSSQVESAEDNFKIQGPRCMRCGKPVRREETEYCHDCAKADFTYEQGRSLYLHRPPVSTAIYQFKFHNKRIYGEFFAKEMASEFAHLIKRWDIQEIIPVPLHPKKRRKRGYNQAEILAKNLSQFLNIPINTSCIYRIENTNPQKELNDKERKRNLKQAFAIDREWQPRGNVLLIDDIYTTGSTIDAMSRLLVKKSRGKVKVYFLTISIGQGDE